MKIQFAHKLLAQPWNIDRPRGRALLAPMLARLRDERPEVDAFGDPLPKLRIEGDVAIIPINGSLLINVPDWVKKFGFGLTDANDIETELTQAVNDPRVKMIVTDTDSGGGWSIAGNKLFDMVEAANRRKPVFAWCADGAAMCSAAYQAAAPTRAIVTAPYATVGSIGTYCAILDDTELWAMMGIKVEVIRSGEHKGAGIDGWSEEQIRFLQEDVDRFGARFRANVSKYRKELPREEMEGQYYPGDEAARRGFTYATAKDFAAALVKFRALI